MKKTRHGTVLLNKSQVSSSIKLPWRCLNKTFPVLSAVCVFLSHWHDLTPVTCAFVAYNCVLVSDQSLWFPVEMKSVEASHLCQCAVSSTLPGCSGAPLIPVVTCPTSGMAILAALNCKTHNPLLTSALSSLLAIMIMWILIDQGDYYHSQNVLLYCPAWDWLSVQNSKQVIMKKCCFLLSLSVSLLLLHSPGTWGCISYSIYCTFRVFQLKNVWIYWKIIGSKGIQNK